MLISGLKGLTLWTQIEENLASFKHVMSKIRKSFVSRFEMCVTTENFGEFSQN